MMQLEHAKSLQEIAAQVRGYDKKAGDQLLKIAKGFVERAELMMRAATNPHRH